MNKDQRKREYPFWNTDLPFEERVNNLISLLTIQEKINFLHGKALAIPRLDIPEIHMGNEALHGVVRPGKSTVFPQAITFAATWDQDLAFRIGTAISDEAKAKQNTVPDADANVYWCPTINMARHPLWGRTPETYGEDPWLCSRIAVNYVKGMQGNHERYLKVGSVPKHFAGNNQDSIRHKCWSNMDLRSLREYYLPAFKATVVEAKAQGLMGAYNAIFGKPCCGSHFLLTEILREEWKFPGFDGNGGFVVTDCSALNDFLWPRYHTTNSRKEAAAQAFNAGIDIECGSSVQKGHLLQAYKKNLITEETINRAVRNILRAEFLLGHFDSPDNNPYTKIGADVIGCEKHLNLAREVAEKGMVLLKNKGNPKPLLPLKPEEKKSIAIVGNASLIAQIGDYSGIPTTPAISPIEGLRKKYPDSNLTLVPWIMGTNSKGFGLLPSINVVPADECKKYRGFKKVTFEEFNFGGKGTTTVDETIDFYWGTRKYDHAVTNSTTDTDGGLKGTEHCSIQWAGNIHVDIPGTYKIRLTYNPSKVNKTSKIDFKIGNQSLSGSGKLVIGLDMQLEHTYPIEISLAKAVKGDEVKLEWSVPQNKFDPNFTREVKAAKSSDVVIAFLGMTVYEERENMDRTTMDLSPDKIGLLKAVVAANPNVIVVIVAGSPLNLIWLEENIPSILIAWIPGQKGGDAIANVLSGEVNPSGKLPFAFHRKDSDVISMYEYDITKGLTYWYNKNSPLYPFGYGLSYTNFSYSDISISQDSFSLRELHPLVVTGKLTNVGDVRGDEIVQVYIRKTSELGKQPLSRPYPMKQLKGFQRYSIHQKETIDFRIEIDLYHLTFYDEGDAQLKVETGRYEVVVGRSSATIEFTKEFEIIP